VPENIWLLLDMPDAACDRHFGFERSERIPARKASMGLNSQLQKIIRHVVSFPLVLVCFGGLSPASRIRQAANHPPNTSAICALKPLTRSCSPGAGLPGRSGKKGYTQDNGE
jgi:hypothetical protein